MSTYTYHLDEAAIRLPSGFRDATVNCFEWIDASGPIALTIQREKRKPEVTFDELVARATEGYPKTFAAYAEEEPMDVEMPVPAVSKRFRWRRENGVVYHHQVFLDLDPIVLLLTAAGTARSSERIDEVLNEALTTLQRRESGA